MDCSPSGSSVHRISQARILEWVVISSSREPSQPRNQTCVSCISCVGRCVLYHWAMGKPMRKCTWCSITSTLRTWVMLENWRVICTGSIPMTLFHWLPSPEGFSHITQPGFTHHYGHWIAKGFQDFWAYVNINAASLWCLLTLRKGWLGMLKTAELSASIQKLKRKGLHSGVHVLAWWCYIQWHSVTYSYIQWHFTFSPLELFFVQVINAKRIQGIQRG